MKNTWLHLGLGSFHRAHQEYCFDRLIKEGNCPDWQFEAGNIRNDAERTVQGLLKQDLTYTLEAISPEGERKFRQIKALSKVISFEPGLKPLITAGAAPAVRVISFTVTEAGYYLDNDLKLQTADASIAADLKGGVGTIYGVIAAMLAKRRDNNAGRVTLLCCDNVRENGTKFKLGLTQFLAAAGRADLIAYLNENCTCPNTMVDRITPRPTAEVCAEVKELTGFADEVPVMAESFFQWVVEDNFAAGRPALEKADVELVQDVAPFEDAKLRILNASHSCLALLGVLKGYNYVFECARDPELHELTWNYVTSSVIPCIAGNGIDLEAYRDEVLRRFKNDHIRDTLQRICQDSFSKMISFVKPTLVDCYHKGVDPKGVVLIAAAYLNFLDLLKAGKVPFEYQDSTFDPQWAAGVTGAQDPAAAYAATKLLFDDLAESSSFTTDLRERLAFIKEYAAKQV